MKIKKIIFGFVCVCLFLSAIGGCGDATDKEYTFRNAGFEIGTLTGWTAEGTAFTNKGVSVALKDKNGVRYNYEGDFFFSGAESAAGNATGTLLSEPFKLKGNGKIGFLIGAGKNTSKCYVALVGEDGETELEVRANYEFDENDMADVLHRVILDGSKHTGKTVRVKIVDKDAGIDGYNYINVDDFIVNYHGSESPTGKIFLANNYIEENSYKVNKRYRLSYHVMPQIGWCNDPNGFSYFGGNIHLFYQYHPYSSAWGPMHWGHVTSKDFIKWEYRPVALAPDSGYDSNGCFSGSAIENDGKLYLFYTGVNAGDKQLQCFATSSDGFTFVKSGRNPVINERQLGPGMTAADFRDPYVFKKGGVWYLIAGTRVSGYGNLALYRSANLSEWQFVGYMLNVSDPAAPNYRLTGVYECPAYAVVDGHEILICSPQNLSAKGTEFENVHSVVYMAGKLDAATGKFVYDKFGEIDGGFDFYAAQTMNMPDGRTVMTAWMQMWDRTFPTAADGWAGAMILPRELSYKNGRLYQSPVREIEKYRKNEVKASRREIVDGATVSVNGIDGDTIELEFSIEAGNAERSGVRVFAGTIHETRIYYDAATGTVVLDRSRSGVKISGAEANGSTRSVKVALENGVIKFRIFLDNTSCEVFVNDGFAALTANIYADDADTGIEFFAEGGNAVLVNAVKYDIVVS
ncbi:MAG: glycoside hydrolase family 32 protein [Clostridia bacterium]|nr:glycoside hydrolase family 32 protein [Clostridia bacterium]